MTSQERFESEAGAIAGVLLDDAWLTLEQAARACSVEAEWLEARGREGLLAEATSTAGVWRLAGRTMIRARRMRVIERDFDAAPELAALVADLIEELEQLRAKLRQAGIP